MSKEKTSVFVVCGCVEKRVGPSYASAAIYQITFKLFNHLYRHAHGYH